MIHSLSRNVLVLSFVVLAVARSSAQSGWKALELPHGVDRASLRSMFFLNIDTGWVAGNGIVLMTTDGGERWSDLDSDGSILLEGLHFVDTRIGWGWNSDGVYRTADGGKTWVPRIDGIVFDHPDRNERLFVITDAYFHGADLGWIVGNFQGIYRTTDAGVSWKAQHLHWNDGGAPMEFYYFTDILFVSADTGWAVGGDRALFPVRTTNGGEDWIGLTRPVSSLEPGTMVAADFDMAGHGFAAGFTDDYHVTLDGGISWSQRSTGHGDVVAQDISRSDTATIWIAGSTVHNERSVGALLHSDDGGATWERIVFDTIGILTQVGFPTPSRGYARSQRGELLRYDAPSSSVHQVNRSDDRGVVDRVVDRDNLLEIFVSEDAVERLEIVDMRGMTVCSFARSASREEFVACLQNLASNWYCCYWEVGDRRYRATFPHVR